MKNKGRIARFRSSLLYRYLFIILIALLFVPIVFPVTLIAYGLFQGTVINPSSSTSVENPYVSKGNLEKTWHEEALKLAYASDIQIEAKIRELKKKYSKANLFWVDQQGKTRIQLPVQPSLPEIWSASYSIDYMKTRSASSVYAVVAFIGDKPSVGRGFMVFEIPYSVTEVRQQSNNSLNGIMIYILLFLLFFIGFIVVSWLFFVRIRKRLLRLEAAMTLSRGEGLPQPIKVKRLDEIGQLENAFNGMVLQLSSSLQREREEEGLRKRLIANLSHDLRTPLTVIRSHMYSMQKEPLSDQGRELLQLTESKISDLSGLIDNLLSYNLLTSGKYKLTPERMDVLRLVRESAAAWYPLWEKEQFEVDIQVQDEPLYWWIDAQWFRRILDNLFQNILRHAHDGKYIGVYTESLPNGSLAVVIIDHGAGMDASIAREKPELGEGSTTAHGAGIGLAIVEFLTREMEIALDIRSSAEGTRVYLYPAVY
ncbi:HAMP domain-containing sensor histidine kinase [Paenibacillus pini]|uniref:histidine kinase n=1 Tax=Paenibacillus pini JCM 16418 TaxID=1236976 RepID=W7Z6B2_9BACL|nr:histidine kinase dimerization/phospho-acceptor domain-containing protein [Paenibacillus pini]GAF09869.1 sensor histidine kinase [Paenibacillus pini JCM 16418]